MSLSLNQRRFLEAFKQDYFSQWEKDVKAVIGDGVVFDVKWDTFYNFTEEGDAETVSQFWSKLYFEPLKKTFADICVDDMGKEALQAKLKTVVISGENESWDSEAATFVDGVFTINQMPFSEKETAGSRTDIWTDIIQKGL